MDGNGSGKAAGIPLCHREQRANLYTGRAVKSLCAACMLFDKMTQGEILRTSTLPESFDDPEYSGKAI